MRSRLLVSVLSIFLSASVAAEAQVVYVVPPGQSPRATAARAEADRAACDAAWSRLSALSAPSPGFRQICMDRLSRATTPRERNPLLRAMQVCSFNLGPLTEHSRQRPVSSYAAYSVGPYGACVETYLGMER